MYKIKSRFEVSYGHRLLNHCGQCRFLHGHNGVIELTLKAAALDAGGMVQDFGVLKARVKPLIEGLLDHKTVLEKNDPLVPVLLEQGQPLTLTEGAPTAENLCRLIWDTLKANGITPAKVSFGETQNNFASYKE